VCARQPCLGDPMPCAESAGVPAQIGEDVRRSVVVAPAPGAQIRQRKSSFVFRSPVFPEAMPVAYSHVSVTQWIYCAGLV
jgi:hypothetical protein